MFAVFHTYLILMTQPGISYLTTIKKKKKEKKIHLVMLSPGKIHISPPFGGKIYDFRKRVCGNGSAGAVDFLFCFVFCHL